MSSRSLIFILLLSFGARLGAAELPPLSEPASKWAAALGHGAVATAEKRGDGRWTFAIAGQPFAAGHAEVPPQQVLFEIGSITKVFTGILVAEAVLDGKLSLDDTLAQRLPVKFGNAATGALTLRQLATHTSCLPSLPDDFITTGDDPYANYDKKRLFEYLAGAKLEKQPPCAFEYSNLGFGILGVVVETAYGKPWATLIQEKITGPLGMVDTAADLSPAQRSRFAEPWSGDQRAHPWTLTAFAGAGALRSTLADMSRFADALLAGPKGRLGRVWPLLAGDYAERSAMGGKIGLGLLHAKAGGEDLYGHEGGTGGFRSLIEVRPASGRAVVVLASNVAAEPGEWLAAWEKGPQPQSQPVARTKVRLPAEALAEYAGEYDFGPGATLTVKTTPDGLQVTLTGQQAFLAFCTGKDRFDLDAVAAALTFERDAAGKVVAVVLHQNGSEQKAPRR
jgi:CubicO group peptidase (beta-lactamase class C family)